MSRSNSPGYPNFSLSKAVSLAHAIYSEDRRNPIDRVVAAKHIGYTSLNGAAEKALGSLSHYNLIEKAGKGQVRVSQAAVDILHPESPEGKKAALRGAAFNPQIFNDIKERFTDGLPSEEALKSWLMRQEFLDRAIVPVTRAFLETCQYLEQEKAIESSGDQDRKGEESSSPEQHKPTIERNVKFGGAEVGDLIQWESGGVLQFEQPRRVRLVTEDGEWVAVEGSETGVPMSEAIVHTKAAAATPQLATSPPSFPEAKKNEKPLLMADEREWLRGPLSKETSYRLIVSGDLGPKEIGKLIKLLEAQKSILSDDEDEAERPS